MGWVKDKMPKLVSVQAEGCMPIVKAYNEGKDHSEFFQNAQTVAGGVRVPKALGDFLVLQAIRETGGTAIAISDAELIDQLIDGEEPFPRGCLILGCMPALRPAYHAIVQVGSVYTSAGAKHLWLSSHVSHWIPQMASPFHRRQFGDHPGA